MKEGNSDRRYEIIMFTNLLLNSLSHTKIIITIKVNKDR